MLHSPGYPSIALPADSLPEKVNRCFLETKSFSDLPISPEILRAIQDMGFEEATPIQSEAIPYILEGRDILGQAQTGTGKTCAFGIPIIDRTAADDGHVQYLILSPTRELAIQIADELHEVTKYKEGIRVLCVYGGQPIDRQILALKKKPQIIVGTPGRVLDHLRRRTIRLDNLQGVILDEADEMLNMGFKEDIDTILASTPEQIQKIFFSATMPATILELTDKYLKDPIHVRIAGTQATVSNIEQFYIEVRESNKLEVLCRLIEAERIKLALVFCNMKLRVDEICEKLQTRGYAAEALHGDMKQQSRTRVMNRFKKGQVDLLVATDVAARGIDVDDIEVVINYDLPQDEEYYVHRVGRTGRAGKSGKAYTFVVGREIIDLKNIQRHTKSNIQRAQPPTLVDVTESRVTTILDQARTTLAADDLSQYVAYVEKFVDGLNVTGSGDSYYTTADVAAALLRQAMGTAIRQSEEIEPVVPYDQYLTRNSAPRLRSGGAGRSAGRSPGRSDEFRRALLQGSDGAAGDTDADPAEDAKSLRAVDFELPTGLDDDLDGSDENAAGGTAGSDRPRPKRSKPLEPGMSRLFINVGADDKVQPRHVVEAICSRSGLTGKQIGAIAIYGRYTFVDVPAAAANEVVDRLTNQKIAQRVVRVEKSGSAAGTGKPRPAGQVAGAGQPDRERKAYASRKPASRSRSLPGDRTARPERERRSGKSGYAKPGKAHS